jgi:hypothetical protein
MYPRYELLLENGKCLMIGQKKQILRSAYYLITIDLKDITRKDIGYIGKLRSNLLGTEFSLFGEGENPKTKLPPEQIRNEHTAILYKSSIINNQGEPQINVVIPKVIDDNTYYVWKPLKVFVYTLR